MAGKRRCCSGIVAVCALALAILVGFLKRKPDLAAQICRDMLLMHQTFWYGELTAYMWLKDMRYKYGEIAPGVFEVPYGFKPGDDFETKICRLSVYVKFAEELNAGNIITPLTDRRVTLPPAERVEAYVEVCKETLAMLPESLREVLNRLKDFKEVPDPLQFYINLTHPWMNGRFTKSMYDRLDDYIRQEMGHVHPEHKVQEWILEREEAAAKLPSLEGRYKTMEDMRNIDPKYIEGFKQMDFWPVKDEHIEVTEIADALVQGRTAVFDATKLCGKELFNLTIPDIARLHGDMAKDIPAFKSGSAGYGDGTYDTLAELGMRFANWNAMGWQHYPDFGPFVDIAEVAKRDARTTPKDWAYEFFKLIAMYFFGLSGQHYEGVVQYSLRTYRQQMTQTTINLHRLPKLPIKNLRKELGDPDWVSNFWTLLWIGPVGDFWHFDEEDNLLICVSGNLYVSVMEQNYTDLVSGTRNIGLGWNDVSAFFQYRTGQPHWIDKNPWIRKVPVHFLKLEPGMGITVPSKTYHNVMALDGNRILMNNFFIPKWRARETGWYTPGTQTELFRAMWTLKTSTLFRLWETRKVGGFFAGYKLEFI